MADKKEKYVYRFPPCSIYDMEAMELNSDPGWNYVTSCGPFHFYCTGSHDTREMHTDPQVQSMTIDILRKKERINLIFSFVCLIMNTLFFVNEFLLSEVTGLFLYADNILLLLQLVLGLWLFILLLVRQFYLWNLRNRLTDGFHPNHIKNWHHTAALCRFSLIFTILLTASVLALSIYTAFFR